MPMASSLSMGTSMFNCTTPGRRPISTPPVMVQRLRTSASVRVGQIGTWCGADVPDKRAQAGKRTGNGMWLKEENGMLACVWWEGSHLTCSLRKLVGVSCVHRQANLAVVVEDDGISLLKAKGIDDCATLDTADAALTGSLNTAGRPRRATAWTLFVNERIITKGGFIRHHCTGRGC